jgi:hypothetical protein
MPSPGELQKKVAATLGVDDTEAATTWRTLREAGLVTKGGRGRSAAQVTYRDAAILIYAICGSTTIKDTPAFIARADTSRGVGHKVANWAPLGEGKIGSGKNPLSPAWELDCLHVNSVTGLPTAHSALDVLEGFLIWAGEEHETPKKVVKELSISVTFEIPGEVTWFKIGCMDAESNEYYEEQFYSPSMNYHYDGRNLTDDTIARIEADGHPVRRGDMETVRSFSLYTLGEVGRFVAGGGR